MFGFTEEQVAWFGMTFGVGAFMCYMLFIIGELAWSIETMLNRVLDRSIQPDQPV